MLVAAALTGAVSCNEDSVSGNTLENILLSRHELHLTQGSQYELTYTLLPESISVEESLVWTSENTDVATVENGIVTAVSPGSTRIVIELAGVTDMCNVNVSDMQLDSIVLNETSVRLAIGSEMQLEASVFPEGMDAGIEWSSDNSDIASVDENGNVTAHAEGLAIITASVGDVYAKCNVVVEPGEIESISLTPESVDLKVGEKHELTLTITPEEFSDVHVSWSSENERVATIANGTVSAISAGQTVITAAVGEMTATCTVNVSNIEVESVTLDVTSTTLMVGETLQLTATVLPENATVSDVSWSTSNSAIATVTNSGLVSAVAPGEVEITATSGEKSAVCSITVEREGGSIGDTDWQVGDVFDVAGYDKGVVVGVSDTYITIMHTVIGKAAWSTATVETQVWEYGLADGRDGTSLLKEYAAGHPGEYPAIEWCVSQGENWFMPLQTELTPVLREYEAINAGLSELGGSQIVVEDGGTGSVFWTCIEYDWDATKAKTAYYEKYSWSTEWMISTGSHVKTEEHYVILLQRIDF